MEEKFCTWLIKAEGKIKATGINYSKAIHVLSQHYSSHTGDRIDIYQVDNDTLSKITRCYESDGRFSKKGYERHGLYRAAIKALYRFRLSRPVKRPDNTPKPAPRYRKTKKKTKEKSLAKRIYEYFIGLFRVNKLSEVPFGYFEGTKKQIVQHLTPLAGLWEKDILEKYLLDNPQCQRCRSSEFPKVFEKPPLSLINTLKLVLKDLPKRKKQQVLISNIESQFKSQVSKGDRLLVLCRTCSKKNEKSKLERFPHDMPDIMRQGPSELKY